jgi:HD-GYP domain-containing protein (c-di-GMP phosphodiesterase class II)
MKKPVNFGLTEEEFNSIKEHPVRGVRIIEPIHAYHDILDSIRQHHEHFDGSGYPYGLRGEEIVLPARILAVADVFDALLSDRPYRPGMSIDTVIEVMQADSGKKLDPQIWAVFLDMITAARATIRTTENPSQALMHALLHSE